jgi:hypothetical protein
MEEALSKSVSRRQSNNRAHGLPPYAGLVNLFDDNCASVQIATPNAIGESANRITAREGISMGIAGSLMPISCAVTAMEECRTSVAGRSFKSRCAQCFFAARRH